MPTQKGGGKMRILPIPKKVKELPGLFIFGGEMTINFGDFSSNLIKFFNQDLKFKNVIPVNEKATIELKRIKVDDEAYKIKVSEEKIEISASTDQGIFYAIKTLKQIKKKNSLQCLEIEDSPDLKIRGVMVDISRAKVPTLKTLKEMVDLFSDLKYNHLELYVEGFSFEYKSFP